MQNKIFDYFTLLKKNDILGSSYLFVGDNSRQVMDILKLANCQGSETFCNECWECKRIDALNHPDLFLVEPEPHMIKIEKIREAQGFLSLKSFRAKRKILLIKGAESFGSEAANAFLKTLEEPPKNSFIAVCTTKLEGLLPTIVSRCRKIFLTSENLQTSTKSLEQIAEFFKGTRIEFKDRTQFSLFLWTLIVLVRDELLSKTATANNKLLTQNDCAIMLPPRSPEKLEKILEDMLKIYSAYSNINENLALNLVRMSFGQA